MPIEITMPALSPTMEEGNLAKWLVKEGAQGAPGDVIAEIETDKATMEVEAVDEGTVARLVVPAGTEGVKVNAVIAVLAAEGEDASAAAKSGGEAAPKAEAKAEPAATEAPAKAEPAKTEAPKAQPSATGPGKAEAPAASGQRTFASPLARRIAKDAGIDDSAVSGSGPKGSVVKADVEAAIAGGGPKVAPASKAVDTAAPTTPRPMSDDAVLKLFEEGSYELVPHDNMRKTIARRLVEAKSTIPHFYLRRDIKLDALLKFRGDLNAQLAPRGVKLSVNDFIIKACALALQSVPAANAVWAGDRVLQLKPSAVAVAVAIDGGLFTPVLQDAEMKSLSALSAEMKDLATRARDRKLAPHEYQGGSFAISNLGMIGIDNFDAVINPPHGAILAVGSGVKKPIVGNDGELTVATVMSVTLSVDHRVIDGALGAELLKAIVDNLENPMVMLA